jgi:two-component system OmpR family sensor kinase
MKTIRLTLLGSMITTVALTIGAGTSLVIVLWVVVVGGHEEEAQPILIGAGLALPLALGVGLYFAVVVAKRVREIEKTARKVAEGDFGNRIPVDHSGELGRLARTFNEMQRRLAELDRVRKQFVANASHELRTPIFSLSGFLELLEDEDPEPLDREEFVRTMREQLGRLTKLTTDLLDLSQLDAGGVVLTAHGVDLNPLVEEIAREFGPRVALRGSQLELRLSERPVTARADADRVRQVIRILLDNALTHTPGGVRVTVTTYTVNHRAKLTVSDDGPGIPDSVRERMFERFFTGDAAGGSGLGLAIAAELAQRMEGRMTASASSAFTAFTLELPPAPGGAQLAAPEQAPLKAPA